MTRLIDTYDTPLALAATYFDRMPGSSHLEACRAAAWRVTDEQGGWCHDNAINTDNDLALILERLLPSWLAVAGNASLPINHPDRTMTGEEEHVASVAALRLFYITADTDEGHDRSLFVWAETPAAAVAEWREYYDLDEDDDVDYGRGRDSTSADGPRMMDFPAGAPSGPVAWWSGDLEEFGAWF